MVDSRLMNLFRTPEQLHTQANISAPLPSKPVEEKPYIRTLKRVEYPANTAVSPTSELPNKIHRDENSEETPKKDDTLTAFIKQEKTKKQLSSEKHVSVQQMDVDEVVPETKQKTVEEEEFVFVRCICKIKTLFDVSSSSWAKEMHWPFRKKLLVQYQVRIFPMIFSSSPSTMPRNC